MAKLDRYILSQLMRSFAFFAVVLVGIYWINRAVQFFDSIVGSGKSMQSFLEFTAVFLPQVVAIVLPVISLAASIYVTNRLIGDREFSVLQAAGHGPMRLIRPYIIFGLLVAILAGVLSHFLVPMSKVKLRQLSREMSQDVTANLVSAGTFLHPTAGVTFYIREILPTGELLNIFLHDQRNRPTATTYTALKALLIQDGEDVKLLMFEGQIETFDESDDTLGAVRFEEFSYDMGTFVNKLGERQLLAADFSTRQLLAPTADMLEQTKRKAENLIYSGHNRVVQPFNSMIYALVGMVVLLTGGFSRFGSMRQIFTAVGAVIFLNLLTGLATGTVRNDISVWYLMYVPTLVGIVMVAGILYFVSSGRKRRHFLPTRLRGAAT